MKSENCKLAMVIGSLASGGAERVCVTLANYFIQYGIDVTIYIKSGSRKSIYELNSEVKVKEITYLRAYGNKLKLLFCTIQYIKGLYAFLKKDNPDIVISFGETSNMIAIPICKKIKKKIIATEHISHTFTKTPLLYIVLSNLVRRFIYKCADVVTVLTQTDYNYYRIFLKNVIVMYNPINGNPASYNNAKEEIILGAGSYVLYYVKGFDLLIKMLPEKLEKWKVLLAGKGEKEYLNHLIQNENKSNFIQLLGEVKDIDCYYERASIFVLPSRTEGFGMVLLEAMSFGCACVSFDCLGPREIIDNGVDGFIIKQGDLEGFRTKLIELQNNKELRERIGKAAMEKSKLFSVELIGKKWLAIIDSLLTQTKSCC